MITFIIRRLLWAIPVLFFVALVSFFLMHQAPGGPFDKDNDKRQLDPATLKALNARFGLDKPSYFNPAAFQKALSDGERNPITLGRAYLDSQFFNYLAGALRGDLGPSYKQRGRNVQDILIERWPFSARLGILALAFSLIIGIPLGVLAALRQNSWSDYISLFFCDHRRIGAQFRDRFAGDHCVWHCAQVDLDLDQRLEYHEALHRAQPGARPGLDVVHHADHARVDAGDQAPGLCPHCAGQGAVRARRDLPPYDA
jgi:hypothetical protein